MQRTTTPYFNSSRKKGCHRLVNPSEHAQEFQVQCAKGQRQRAAEQEISATTARAPASKARDRAAEEGGEGEFTKERKQAATEAAKEKASTSGQEPASDAGKDAASKGREDEEEGKECEDWVSRRLQTALQHQNGRCDRASHTLRGATTADQHPASSTNCRQTGRSWGGDSGARYQAASTKLPTERRRRSSDQGKTKVRKIIPSHGPPARAA